MESKVDVSPWIFTNALVPLGLQDSTSSPQKHPSRSSIARRSFAPKRGIAPRIGLDQREQLEQTGGFLLRTMEVSCNIALQFYTFKVVKPMPKPFGDGLCTTHGYLEMIKILGRTRNVEMEVTKRS